MTQLKEIHELRDPTEYFCSEIQLQEVNYQENELHDIQSKEIMGQAVRTIKNGRIGTCRGGVKSTVAELLEQARDYSSYGRDAKFELPAGNGLSEIEALDDRRLHHMQTSEMRQLGQQITDEICDRLPAWTANVYLSYGRGTKRIVNSNGIDHSTERKQFSFVVMLSHASEGNITEIADGRVFFPSDQELKSYLDDLIMQAELALNTIELEAGKYPVLLHPVALSSFIAALEEAVHGKKIFDGLSPLAGRLGDAICSQRISLWDDPLDKSMTDYNSISDEGVLLKRRPIIEEGVLKTYLTNLEYGSRLNQPITGHGYRLPSIITGGTPLAEPAISPMNWIIDPGDQLFESMLKSIKKGLFLVNTWDVWSGSLINGDISGSVHLGFLVENGILKGRVKDMRVSGNIYSFLGDQLAELSIEQPVTMVGQFRAPYMLLDNVSIA